MVLNEQDSAIGSPITNFIKNTKEQTILALGADWELKKPIDLELSAIVNGKVGGGLDIQVINFGAKIEAEQIQKIKLSIGPKSDVEEAEKRARIETAKAQEKMAQKIPFHANVQSRK